MSQEIKFGKIIARDNPDTTDISFDGFRDTIIYTSEWEEVAGTKGVRCRTWKLERGDGGVDGADIFIEAGGYTPIQYVNSADMVVDTPESGECYCVVLDLDGQVQVHHFNDSKKGQMVWNQGMIITWIAVTEVRFTEFEKPSFHDEMFANIPEETAEYQGRSLTEYNQKVDELRRFVDHTVA